MRAPMFPPRAPLVVGITLILAARASAAPMFMSLGGLPDKPHAEATAISADGSVAVGLAYIDPRAVSGRAFRWTQTGGMVGLGVLPGEIENGADGVSADGSVVVGGGGPVAVAGGGSASGAQAFRWTQEGGLVGLGRLPGDFYSHATGVSADGSLVIGFSRERAETSREAFRWTSESGMVGLGYLPGAAASEARGVSSDGSVIVGSSWSPSGHATAFRWTQADGMTALSDLCEMCSDSYARAVSADGR